MLGIVVIIIFLVGAVFLVLNWSCLSEGMNSGQLCLRADYGLGQLGLTSENSTCVCGGSAATPTQPTETEETPETSEAEEGAPTSKEIPVPS